MQPLACLHVLQAHRGPVFHSLALVTILGLDDASDNLGPLQRTSIEQHTDDLFVKAIVTDSISQGTSLKKLKEGSEGFPTARHRRSSYPVTVGVIAGGKSGD